MIFSCRYKQATKPLTEDHEINIVAEKAINIKNKEENE